MSWNTGEPINELMDRLDDIFDEAFEKDIQQFPFWFRYKLDKLKSAYDKVMEEAHK